MGEKAFEPVAEMLFCNGTDRDTKFVPDQKESRIHLGLMQKTLRSRNLRSTKVRCQKMTKVVEGQLNGLFHSIVKNLR